MSFIFHNKAAAFVTTYLAPAGSDARVGLTGVAALGCEAGDAKCLGLAGPSFSHPPLALAGGQ